MCRQCRWKSGRAGNPGHRRTLLVEHKMVGSGELRAGRTFADEREQHKSREEHKKCAFKVYPRFMLLPRRPGQQRMQRH